MTIETSGPADYLEADDQIHSTVGLDIGADDRDDVGEPTDEELGKMVSAIESPKRYHTQPGQQGVPTAADGSRRDLPPMALPGFGDEYDDCGDDIPLFCEGCGNTAIVGRTCGRSVCPRCGAAWVRDRSINITSRLAATRAVRDYNREDHQRFHHVVLSPPADWHLQAADPLDRTFHVIRDMLASLDLEGYVFYHPWAGDTAEGEDDQGMWSDRLFSGRDFQGDVRDELQLRPHFHCIVVGNEVPGGSTTRELQDRTGWILKRILKGEDSKVSLYDEEDLAEATTYSISHTAIDTTGEQNQAQYRGFGSVLNSVDILPDTREEMEMEVREAAPTTLGVKIKSQLCLEKTIKPPEGDDLQGPLELINDAADNLEPDPEAATEPDPAPDPVEDQELEKRPCKGRMLHIREADRDDDYLNDPEWLATADHAADLQSTWDDWSDRLDELIGWGG